MNGHSSEPKKVNSSNNPNTNIYVIQQKKCIKSEY